MTLVESHPSHTTPLFADALAAPARTHPAVITATGVVTYGDLERRVTELAAALDGERRLVLIEAANDLDSVVAYLAALRQRHVVLLAPAATPLGSAHHEAAWAPDIVVRAGGRDPEILRSRPRHRLHPDLALLLSTSGSTGAPRLVRLARDSIEANAHAIATYLRLSGADRAITSLPMGYCYGLSVINSHLVAGATIVVTDRSVVDPCFWKLFEASGATNFAGVPHTFDLLDRIGFDAMRLPTLRFVTQAGGRLTPSRVRRFADLAAERAWDFYVMYGQTEATARMAYLPPQLARSHPGAVGIAIPGGELRIDEPDADGVGELVYRGPNVMLGYAAGPDDLASGEHLTELRTGDLARATPEGLHEIVGRRSRFIKPAGLRIDLDRLERALHEEQIDAVCTGDDDGVVVAVENAAQVRAAGDALTDLGVARAHRVVVALAEIPRLANGKPDYIAIAAVARATARATEADEPTSVDGVFIRTFGHRPPPGATFVSLGGDSLTYIEVSIQLEAVLGELPADWHVTPVDKLVARGRPKRVIARAETTAVVRAAAIVFIVATHTKLWHVPGGAHALLAVAGFNFARFQLAGPSLWSSIARIAIPSIAWIGVVAAIGDKYGWPNVVLLHNVVERPGDHWGYWFIEALVWTLAALAVALRSRAVRDVIARHPFGVPVVATLAALVLRFGVFTPESAFATSRPLGVLWLFTIGWAAAAARDARGRIVVSTLAAAGLIGFFGDPTREATIFAAILLVVWARSIVVPRVIQPALAAVATASLYIYLTHFQVFPPIERVAGPAAALVGSIVAGVAVAATATPLAGAAGAACRAAATAQRRARAVPCSSSSAL